MPTLQQLQARAKASAEKRAKRKPLEKEVEGPVKKYAKSLGFWARKFKSEGNRSVPDDVFATPHGQVFFVEFKRPGGKPTPAQEDEHKEMRKNKIKVHVIDNIEDGKALIDAYLEDDQWL